MKRGRAFQDKRVGLIYRIRRSRGFGMLGQSTPALPWTIFPWLRGSAQGSQHSLIPKEFSFLHNHAVNVWGEDIMYRRWPERLIRMCKSYNRELLKKVCYVAEEGAEPVGIMVMMYAIGQVNATLLRHNISLDEEISSLVALDRFCPERARSIERLVDVLYELPTITYNRETDLRNYEAAIKRVAQAVDFKGKLALEKNGQYEWVVKE